MTIQTMEDQGIDEFDAILDAVRDTPKGRWFIEELGRRNRVADTNELLAAINTLRAEATETLKAATIPNDATTIHALRRELEDMSLTIRQTRTAIASIKPEENAENRIMMASGELDAIISSTERATSEILSGAERIQEISDKLREQGADEDLCDEIESHATGIFMACSFQDITGQRITKVVGALKYLEHRLNYMVTLWDKEAGDLTENPDTSGPIDPRPDAHLLSGPQKEDEAPSQSEIDDIFGSLGFEIAPNSAHADNHEIEVMAGTSDIVEEKPAASQHPIPQLHIIDDVDFAENTPSSTDAGDQAPGFAATEEIEQDDIDAMFN